MTLKTVINAIVTFTTWQFLIGFALVIAGIIQIALVYIVVGAVTIHKFLGFK